MMEVGAWHWGIFNLRVESNNKTILNMADNFLDFSKGAGDKNASFKVLYCIHSSKQLRYSHLGIPLLLQAAINAGGVLLSLSNGKAFVVVNALTGRVDAVVEDFKSIKLERLTDFLFFQSLRHIALLRGLFALHASVVQRGDKVFLITGPQNAGKSTVAASLMRGGYQILADDDCFFSIANNQLKLYPFPTKMGFKQAGEGRFVELHPHLVDGYVYGQKKRFSLQHLYVKPKAFYQQVRIFFPRYMRRGQLSMKTLSMNDALGRMIRGNLPFVWRKQMPTAYFESFLAFRNLINISRTYELRYNDQVLHEFASIKLGEG